MGLKTFTTGLSQLGKESSNRCDVNFIDFYKEGKQKTYPFKDLFSIQKFEKKDRLDLLEQIEDDFYYVEIGNTTKEGDVEPQKLNFLNRTDSLEDYFKKIETGDIQQADEANILLAKVRPNLKKYILIDGDNKDYFFTTAFINLKPKKLNKLLYYSMRSIFYEDLMAISRQGKGYPTLKESDLFTLRLNKKSIDKLEANENKIVAQIESIEKIIKELKAQFTPPQEIINKVFAREFGFDIERVNKVEQQKYSFVSNYIAYRNLNLRTSARWNKIAPIQKVLYENNPFIEKLSRYITSTKNGWSPTCGETDTEYYVFGVNSISKNSTINYNDLKKSNEQKNNIKDFYVKNNDLFVSRGNTVDLVALASVVNNLPVDKNIIFPDLFIRIEVKEKDLLKEYLAHLFNSIIGRYYFKYSAKGKNQTMVKISLDELNNFYLPIPPLMIQQKIVDEIKVELDKQEDIKKKIETERNKIDEIIEKAIK